jgi:glutathione synthase/RimK-type ligase-like ATP-grasp enzyme
MEMPINFVVIANPENRRVGFLQQALERCSLPPATVVNYSDLIAGRDTLERFNVPDTLIRFDSPEKNFELDKAIIAAGADVPDTGNHQRISAADAVELEFDKGRILYPRQWYLGWRHLLQQWEKELKVGRLNVEGSSELKVGRLKVEGLNQSSNIHSSNLQPATQTNLQPANVPTFQRVMNHPEEIAVMFDKPLCHELFSRHGVPVPRSLGIIHNYDQLREVMQARGCNRVFVKLSHGSAASGVVAYYTHPRGESAITTVERVRENGETLLYNSRKIRQYTERDAIADIINILCAEGVQVEEWLPKARLHNRQFDVRVVVIDREAQHVVVRLGNSPMTNLHLGNERTNLDALLTLVKPDDWEEMKRTCEAAAALFPNSLYCGIDLLIRPDRQQHAILEINAFGDLLPGTTWNGMDTYTSEIQAILHHNNSNFKKKPLIFDF